VSVTTLPIAVERPVESRHHQRVSEAATLDILVVDDELLIRSGLAFVLSDAGHRVTEAGDGVAAMELTSHHAYDVAVCDVRLPRIDGFTLLRHLQQSSPRTAVILMTAYSNVSDAVQALRGGAYDYVTKPFDVDQLVHRVGNIAQKRALEEELAGARARLPSPSEEPLEVVCRAPIMLRLLDRLETYAASDAPVLLTGESGTGKELFARRLHALGPRRRGPFLAVNCAALPDQLIEAELFGHERGAFTGAVRRREGRFKAAHGGTLLLDEIGDLSPAMQTKLLRVLAEGRFEALGSDETVQVDVRIVAATNQNLRRQVAERRFREDLYFRLRVLDLEIPPLRERPGDLPLLLEYFLGRFTPPGQAQPEVSVEAWHALERHAFPGNVRELAHAVERAVVLSRGGRIDLEHLPPELADAPAAEPATPHKPFATLAEASREFERGHIRRALALTGGHRRQAAELLGISRKSLWEKMRSLGLGDPD
jgi:DNA-binding NtrC family response regulator